jgi:hypothetical protein
VRNLASHYYGTADVAFGDVVAAHRLEANRLLFGTRLRPSGGADPAVYVVQATGRFLVHEPPGRRGLKPRVDTALTVLVDLKERAVVDFGIAPRRPDLGLLGAPERL